MGMIEIILWNTSKQIKKALYILALGNLRAFLMNRFALILVLLFSISAAGQKSSYEKQIDGLFNKAYEHLDVTKDSAYYYFDKIEDLAVENKDWKTVFEALMSANRNAGTFYDFGKLSHNLKVLDSLFLEHKSYLDSLPGKKMFENYLLYDKGNYYYKIGSFDKAKYHFRKILDSYKGQDPKTMLSEHFDLLTVSLSFMAKTYELEEKFDLAYDYYIRNIDLIKQVTPNDQNTLFINYALLAEVLKRKGDVTTANSYLRLTLKDALEHNNNPNRIVTVANNLAENHLTLKQSDSAVFYLSLMKKHLDRSPYFEHLYYRTKAEVAEQEGNLKAALAQMDAALASYLAHSEQLDPTSLANIYLEKARFLMANGNFQKTVDLANIALDTLQSKFGPIYLKLMALKTKSLVNLEEFEIADTAAHSAVISLDSLKQDYQYSTDKINMVENTYPLFEAAIAANYALFEKTNNSNYLEKAFFYMEKSKSVLLMEAIRSTNANEFGLVQESLLEKERGLRTEITAIEKEVKALKNDDALLRKQIFDLRNQQSKLIDSITLNYPKYHQLRYESGVTTIDYLLKGLINDQILISYFFGDQAVYAVAIGHRGTKFIKRTKSNEIAEQVKDFHHLLSSPETALSDVNRLAGNIYQKVLAPLLLHRTKKIIIIPDGPMNLLPFEVLINPGEPGKYLVEKYPMAYSNSATLLTQLWNGENENETILAFAPTFKGEQVEHTESRDKLLPLPHNTTEVRQIMARFDGQLFENESATLSNFKSNATGYGILHFATHAIFNNEQPEYSYLAFSPKEKNNILYVKDLYNLNLNANLVTLSACETAIGDLKRGEGFIGLARGFFYAGAKSLTSTLWKVNDASTAALMADYYNVLAIGKTKDVALQEAKTNFLRTNRDNNLKHPYYWSGFILSGNYAPLQADWPWVWLVFPLLIIVTVVLVVNVGKKTNPIDREV